MNDETRAVQNDFNAIAALDEPRWNHNNAYFSRILRLLPQKMDKVLDIGCGKGALSALLAERCREVCAVDFAGEMIAAAQTLHPRENIRYICGDVLELPVPDFSLDAIVTVATAHHLPFDWLLRFAKDKLKPGGVLVVLDIPEADSWTEKLFWGMAFLPNVVMNLVKNGKLRKDDAHARALWEAHGARDRYMRVRDIKKQAGAVLSGVWVRRLFFFRYLLYWQKNTRG